MRTPQWVRELFRRRWVFVERDCAQGLTPSEEREKRRIEGLLDAWEAWDLNGTETRLRLRLMLNDIETRLARSRDVQDD